MYLMPQVIYELKKIEDTAKIISSFYNDDLTIYGRFPTAIASNFNINIDELVGKTIDEKYDIILKLITPIYEKNIKEMRAKIKEYQKYWNKNADFVCKELEKIFNIRFDGVEKCYAYVNINTTCPRYLDSHSFDVNFRKTKEQALEVCIHEIIHFYWFQKWKEKYPNCPEENFQAPHIEWLLSEIVIDQIVYYSEFRKIMREKPAYYYFYDTVIPGLGNLIQIFRKLYSENNIDNFMEKGINLLKAYPELVKELTN